MCRCANANIGVHIWCFFKTKYPLLLFSTWFAIQNSCRHSRDLLEKRVQKHLLKWYFVFCYGIHDTTEREINCFRVVAEFSMHSMDACVNEHFGIHTQGCICAQHPARAQWNINKRDITHSYGCFLFTAQMLQQRYFSLLVAFLSIGEAQKHLRRSQNSRRQLLELCTFASNRQAAHDPSCRGHITWDMDESTVDGKSGSYKLVHHDHRCCTDKRFGFSVAGKLQLDCKNTNYGASGLVYFCNFVNEMALIWP